MISYRSLNLRSAVLRTGASIAALALAAGLQPALAAPPPANGWGLPATDVPADPAIRLGTLPNGMRYAIMSNEVPKGAASVRLNFEFGSIGEGEKERGLAHFIEHMAFNGSTNVPEGEMVKILERQGLKFGPDTNASTGFDSTTYMLDLPQADAERIDTALFLMREVAGEVKFDPAAVDRERGVILGERRVRDTFQLRNLIDQIEFQVPETPYPDRLPIGTEEVLKTASAETMRSLYHRYYRPENATLVFVGDVDPAAVEAKIKAKFADWKGVGPAGGELPRGTVDLKRAAGFETFIDPAVPTTVTVSVMQPWADPADTLADRRHDLVKALANGMFNRRLAKIVNAPGSSLVAGGMAISEWEDAALYSSLGVVAKDGAWKAALTIAEQELRRAAEHGFTKSELAVELASIKGKLQTAAEQSGARKSDGLANVIVNSATTEEFVVTPQWSLSFFDGVAGSISLEEVNAEFRKLWTGSAPLVHVAAKQPVAETALAAAFAESARLAVAAPKDEAVTAFAYQDFGKPGTIAEDKRITDLGIRTVRFANNVRLNIKRTDFEPGKISYMVRVPGGQLAIPADKPGLGTMVTLLSALGATGKHSLEELKALTAGRAVTPGLVAADDAFIAAGTTKPADLALQMQLSAAYVTDPGYRPEAAGQWSNIVPIIDKSIAAQPMQLLQTRVLTELANGDARFGLAPTADLARRTLDEARSVLSPVLGSAPIEIGIVGDIDEAAAIAAVAQSFGALAPRQASAPAYTEARLATFRQDKSPIALTHEGQADQYLAGAAWRTDDDADYRTEVGLSLLASVLDLMLTESIREEMGASYGVTVNSNMSDTFRDFGYLMTASVIAPDKAGEFDAAIDGAAKSLRDAPVSADLLARARNPELEKAAKQMRENGYWLAFVDEAQTEAERLDRLRQRQAIIQSITAEQLQALARTYLTDERLRRIRIASDKTAKVAQK